MKTAKYNSFKPLSLPEDLVHITARADEVTFVQPVAQPPHESTYVDVAKEAVSDLVGYGVKIVFGLAGCTVQKEQPGQPVLTESPSDAGETVGVGDVAQSDDGTVAIDSGEDTPEDLQDSTEDAPSLADGDGDDTPLQDIPDESAAEINENDGDAMSTSDDGMTLADADVSEEPDAVTPPDISLDADSNSETDAATDVVIEDADVDATTDATSDTTLPLEDTTNPDGDALSDVDDVTDAFVGPETIDDALASETTPPSDTVEDGTPDTSSDTSSGDTADASDICTTTPQCTVAGPNSYTINAGDPAVATYMMSGEYYSCTGGDFTELPNGSTPVTVSYPSPQTGMSQFGCTVYTCNWTMTQDCPEGNININQPPVINALKSPNGLGILPGGDQCFSPANKVQFVWDASDANNDLLNCTVNVTESATGNKAATVSVTQAAGAAMFADLPAQFLKPRTDYCWDLTCSDGIAAPVVSGGNACFTTSEKGLIGWWRFNEGQGTIVKDDSGSGIDGTLINFDDPTKSWVKTPTGEGLFFDGIKNYIQTNSPASWDSLTSLSAVVTFSNAFPLDQHAVLIDKVGDANNRLTFEFFPDQTLLFGSCGQYVDCAIGNIPQSTFIFNDNSWHTVIGTYSGTTSQLFVDGSLESKKQFTPDGGAMVTSGEFLIGHWTIGDRYYHGTISEVQLYNTDITAQCK